MSDKRHIVERFIESAGWSDPTNRALVGVATSLRDAGVAPSVVYDAILTGSQAVKSGPR